jgi:hypothetical protein
MEFFSGFQSDSVDRPLSGFKKLAFNSKMHTKLMDLELQCSHKDFNLRAKRKAKPNQIESRNNSEDLG